MPQWPHRLRSYKTFPETEIKYQMLCGKRFIRVSGVPAKQFCYRTRHFGVRKYRIGLELLNHQFLSYVTIRLYCFFEVCLKAFESMLLLLLNKTVWTSKPDLRVEIFINAEISYVSWLTSDTNVVAVSMRYSETSWNRFLTFYDRARREVWTL